jgi:hypothetical protein
MQEKLSKITGIHIFSDEDKVIISSEKHILLWKI